MLPGAHVLPKSRVFDDFGIPARSQNWPNSSNSVKGCSAFLQGITLSKLFRKSVERRSGTVLGGSGDARETLWREVLEAFWSIMPKTICCKNHCKNRAENLERHIPQPQENHRKISARS